jgi:hypothetical protein
MENANRYEMHEDQGTSAYDLVGIDVSGYRV